MNKQLTDKQTILEMKLLQERKKNMINQEAMEGPKEAENIRKIPKTRGLKRALEKEKQEAQSLSFDQQLAKEIEDKREVWLERVNIHLEKLLMKANRDN